MDDYLTLLKHFLDSENRLTAFPAKRKLQLLAIAYLAEKLQPGRVYTEGEINGLLNSWHTFRDPETLRRELYQNHYLDRTRDGSAYWAEKRPDPEKPDLAFLYREILLRIQKVDFSAIWKGFHPLKFALYNQEQCYFDGQYIEKTDAFCANTAIEWGDEFIAIWNVSEAPEDLDALSASMIHEMFHAFQMASGERRFPDEKEALFQYRYRAASLAAKRAEAVLLKAILEDGDLDAYPKLLSLRKRRSEDCPYEYGYEAGVEQIEGTANFVELGALTQLNAEKGRLAWQRLLSRISQPEQYFPIRPICYPTGAAVIACIRRCSDMDCESFTGQTFSQAMIAGVRSETAAPDDAEMAACLDRYLGETHRIIQSALQKNDCVLRGSYPLISVNIWDARCEGRYLTSNHFLIYQDGEEKRTIYGDFVIETDAGGHVLAVFRQ